MYGYVEVPFSIVMEATYDRWVPSQCNFVGRNQHCDDVDQSIGLLSAMRLAGPYNTMHGENKLTLTKSNDFVTNTLVWEQNQIWVLVFSIVNLKAILQHGSLDITCCRLHIILHTCCHFHAQSCLQWSSATIRKSMCHWYDQIDLIAPNLADATLYL